MNRSVLSLPDRPSFFSKESKQIIRRCNSIISAMRPRMSNDYEDIRMQLKTKEEQMSLINSLRRLYNRPEEDDMS